MSPVKFSTVATDARGAYRRGMTNTALGLPPSEEPSALLSDAELDQLAEAELVFRAHWAKELGMVGADLFTLPPVPVRHGLEPSNDDDLG